MNLLSRATVLLGATSIALGTAHANNLARDRDPVELTAASLPSLMGADPSRIVAFRYHPGWVQVPIQIDERMMVDFGAVYDTTDLGVSFLAYTDEGTFTGVDTDPLFDADDELTFMGKNAGFPAPGLPEPTGTVPGSGVELEITNPGNGMKAYLYLFESTGTLEPWAGADSIDYTFNLLSGDYKTTYQVLAGPNPENSSVVTSAYSVHFSDRWVRDETGITAGGASGVDVLDRHKSMFAPGNCSRTEDTFSAGEGAFIVNRTGPVRALRGYVGANSGPTTYRVHKFYEEREDIFTALRVHAIGGMTDLFDYSPAATGMTYTNSLNLAGALINADPTGDLITPGPFNWEMVTGVQGTLVSALTINTDIPLFDYSSYYSDDDTPTVTQCTGDADEYGTSGFWEQDPIPNTDPSLGAFNIFEAIRLIAYSDPNRTTTFAESTTDEITTPFTVLVSPYRPATTGLPDLQETTPALTLNAFPNPFSEFLRLQFSIPEGGKARLEVFDVKGRKIATWGSEERAAGLHTVIPDVGGLADGVYLLRLHTRYGSRSIRVIHLH